MNKSKYKCSNINCENHKGLRKGHDKIHIMSDQFDRKQERNPCYPQFFERKIRIVLNISCIIDKVQLISNQFDVYQIIDTKLRYKQGIDIYKIFDKNLDNYYTLCECSTLIYCFECLMNILRDSIYLTRISLDSDNIIKRKLMYSNDINPQPLGVLLHFTDQFISNKLEISYSQCHIIQCGNVKCSKYEQTIIDCNMYNTLNIINEEYLHIFSLFRSTAQYLRAFDLGIKYYGVGIQQDFYNYLKYEKTEQHRKKIFRQRMDMIRKRLNVSSNKQLLSFSVPQIF